MNLGNYDMRNHPALLDHPVGFAMRDGRHFDPVSALVVAGSTLIGSKMSSDASKDAANTQSDAANHAAELQQQQFQQTRDSLQPFINTGYEAQGSLRNLLGLGTPTDTGTYGSLSRPFDAAAFNQYKDPGYQFQLQQGLQGLQNSQAAQNGVLSGAALKDLIGFNQGMANNAYQNAFGRYMTQNDATYNRLSSLLGLGENAAAGVGNTGAQVMSNVGNTLTSGAAARAAGQIGSANAYTSGINNGMGYYMLNNMTGGNLFGTGGGISGADAAASHAAGMDYINSQLAGL
jgi:hypothetical protein